MFQAVVGREVLKILELRILSLVEPSLLWITNTSHS